MGVGAPAAFMRYSETEFLPHAQKGTAWAWLPPAGYRHGPYTLAQLGQFYYKEATPYMKEHGFGGWKFYSGWGQDLGVFPTEEQAARAVAWCKERLLILGEVTGEDVITPTRQTAVVGSLFEIFPYCMKKRHWEDEATGRLMNEKKNIVKAPKGSWRFVLEWKGIKVEG